MEDKSSTTCASGQPDQAGLLWDAVLPRMQEWFCGSDPMLCVRQALK
jgi:hypothetical protein